MMKMMQVALLFGIALLSVGLVEATQFKMVPTKEVFTKELSPTLQIRNHYASCQIYNNATKSCDLWNNHTTCGERVYIFDTANERIVSKKSSPYEFAGDVTIYARIIYTDATKDVAWAYKEWKKGTPISTILNAANKKYCYNGGNFTMDDLKTLYTELTDVPLSSLKGALRNINVSALNLSSGNAFYDVRMDLSLDEAQSKRVGILKFGSHSLNWTVTSQSDWDNGTKLNTSSSTVNGSLVIPTFFQEEINAGSTSDSGAGLNVNDWANRYVPSRTINVSQIRILFGAGAGNKVLAIYDQSGGAPDIPLIYTDIVSSSAGWNVVNINRSVTLVGGSTYYLLLTTNSASLNAKITGGLPLGSQFYTASSAFPDILNPFPVAGSTSNTWAMDMIVATNNTSSGTFNSSTKDLGSSQSIKNLTVFGSFPPGTNATFWLSYSTDNVTFTEHSQSGILSANNTVWNFDDVTAWYVKFNMTLKTDNFSNTSQIDDVTISAEEISACEPPVSGAWSMTENCELLNVTKTCVGNLNVNGYTLAINNSTLYMPSSYYINLTSGSRLIITNGGRVG